jgi:CheY-like chemotaxis protein
VAANIRALSSLLWPLIAAVVLWQLLPYLKKVISQRGFTVKVGQFEITVQQAADQLKEQVSDLQRQLAELGQRTPGAAPGEEQTLAPAPAPPAPQRAGIGSARILWVDDRPDGNAFEITQLTDQGIRVDLARTTNEGLALIDRNPPYTAIITDLGRTEDGTYKETAGIELTRAARAAGTAAPILIYSTINQTHRWDREIRDAGAVATASTVQLMRFLQDAGVPIGSEHPL